MGYYQKEVKRTIVSVLIRIIQLITIKMKMKMKKISHGYDDAYMY